MGYLAIASESVCAALDVVEDVDQAFLSTPGLTVFEDLQAAQDRQAGVLQDRELAGEGAELLGRDLAEGERLLLPLALLLGAALPLLRPSCPLGDLGDEVPHLPDRRCASSWLEASIASLISCPVWSIASN